MAGAELLHEDPQLIAFATRHSPLGAIGVRISLRIHRIGEGD
jgi:hypothetical protein